jgi:hypothetical protein
MPLKSEEYPCGCVLEWDGRCLELWVCDKHRAEYEESYDPKVER